MRALLLFVCVLLFFSSAHAFIAVPRADLIMDPLLAPRFENTTSSQSKPQITFYVLNNGTGVARIVNATLVTTQNHVLLSAPSTIDAGFTSAFRYELATLLCSPGAYDDFYFEAWYYPSENTSATPRNVTSKTYSLNVSDFLSIEGISPQTSSIGVDIALGGRVSFFIRNTGNQGVTYKLNITHPPTFTANLRSSSENYDIADLDNVTFTIGGSSSQAWDLELVPSQLAQDQKLEVQVYSPVCDLVNDSFSKRLTFFYVREGVIDQKIVPDLSLISLIIILFVAGVLVSKFYY